MTLFTEDNSHWPVDELPSQCELFPPVDLPRFGRRLFLGLHLSLTFGSCIWVTVSIVTALLRERPVRLQRPPIDPTNAAQVLRCERDLRALLDDLHRQVFAVQTAELEHEIELKRKFLGYLDKWRDRSAEVRRRCRLDDPTATAMSAALDQLAGASSEIEELATAYGGLLDSFENRYLDQLRTIRYALNEARKAARAKAAAPDQAP